MAARTFAIVGLLATSALAQDLPRQSPPTPPPAQQSADSQQPAPTFRAGTELVRVDATVVDRAGVPVTTLTADDFEIREDGVLQRITSFKLVENDGQPAPRDDTSLTIRSPAHAAAEAARDDVRVFLIFWDEYHIEERVSAHRAREALMSFVRTFGPTDLVAFMDPLTPLEAIRFTRDPLELVETVRGLRGRLGVYTPARSPVEEAQMRYARNPARIRGEVTMSALKAAAAHLGSLREGRKAIILVSEGMRGLGGDGLSLASDVIRMGNDANTAFYAVDPRGIMVGRRRSDLLVTLATGTGGESFLTNQLDLAFQRAVKQSSAFYLLGYAPAVQYDGKFHDIKVRVKRPGMDVRARAGYWAPSVDDMERARLLAERAALPTAMADAFALLAPETAHRSVDVWLGTGLTQPNRPEIRMTWNPREPVPADPDDRPADVQLAVSNGGSTIVDVAVGSEGTRFEAAPGTLQVILTVRNSAGEVIDREHRTLTVPDRPDSAVWIGSPAVYRARNVLEFRALTGDHPPPPHAGREFARTERLIFRFTVHGRSAVDAAVAARLISRQGERLADLTLERIEGAEVRWELDLPLGAIARGDYLVAFEARQGGETSESFVPLRINR